MEKVKAGDSVVIRASTWNAFIDAANWTKEQKQNQLGKGLRSGVGTGIVLIKNAEGEQRDRFTALVLSDIAIPPNVNGVDVTMPVLNFTETHVMKGSRVSTSYKKNVASLTGTVNRSGYRGFSAGEVLFLGASGTKRGKKNDSPWEITFRFAVSPNQSSLQVGKLKVSQKKGWDYLWVRYADKVAENKKNVIKEPVAAYVEQVYPEGDFGNLGLGM